MQILYFGWVRTRIGLGGEEVLPPLEVGDVRGLIEWLNGCGSQYRKAFENISSIRVAINQEIADLDDPVMPGDEVAFFPPMTGG